ncbi:MAG: FIST C-terminal domain-containing protein [gamma proteobacterium symbiont of Taylorina sp.]|nr:FIST C-terminal domain-containing protein [gamma proteobacterium symbiont of Taylorina sp.]
MLNFYSGSSKSVNPKKAIKESINIAKSKTNEEVTLVILHSTSGHNLNQLLVSIQENLPNASIIGCTGSGVISNEYVSENLRAVALTLVTGHEFVLSKVEDVTQNNCYELSKLAAQELKNNNLSINMLMAFAPGLVVNGEEITKGISDVFSHQVPILGGLAGFNGSVPNTFLFYNQEVLEQAIVMVGFFDPSLAVAQASHHGYLPQENQKFIATKVDNEFICELDNKPAWPTLMASFDLPASTLPTEVISLLALGTNLTESEKSAYDNKYKLRAPLILSEDGKAMALQSRVAVGTELTSCQRDEEYLMSGVNGLIERLIVQYDKKDPVAVFQTDCMARGRMSNGVIKKEEITNNLQTGIIKDFPIAWLGMYAFGEFAQLDGKNHYHNYTTSISVLLR